MRGRGKLGACLRVGHDVAGVAAGTSGERIGMRCAAAEPMMPSAEGDVAFASDALAVAGGEAMFELLCRRVPEEDGEHLEVDDALHGEADALEKVIGIEDACDLAGDLVDDGEGLGLAGDAGVEACVLDGDGHSRGDKLEETLVLGGEEAGDLGFEVENADDLVLDDERDGEFGANGGIGADVVLGVRASGDVLDAEGAALEGQSGRRCRGRP